MKPLHEMSTAEKAQLLHELFPQEMPRLLDFMKNICEVLNDNITNDIPCDITGLGSAHTMDVCIAIIGLLATHYACYEEDATAFAELFADGKRNVAVYCLSNFVNTQRHTNRTFSIMVNLLFND